MAQDYMFSNYYTLFLKEINNSVGKGPGIMERDLELWEGAWNYGKGPGIMERGLESWKPIILG
jgi:hypothetical protein